MKLASWNVNSIKIRNEAARAWLAESNTDVLLLQEIKCETDKFPGADFHVMKYEHVTACGQKAYNGVAAISRRPFELIHTALPGDESDVQARYLEIKINNLHIINIYAPNGNPIGTEKFDYKLKWLMRLEARLKELLSANLPFVVMGDYNIIPGENDCHDPAAWIGDALYQPESRGMYRRLINLGLTDAVRMFYPTQHLYTFWDYQGGAWSKDFGIRIDHILMSPSVADRCTAAGVDKTPRAKEQPSDHVPVWVELR